MDAQSILVDNLRQALQQLQRYLAFGFTAALALLTLALGGPIAVPGVPLPIDPALARTLLIAIYIGAAFLSYAAVLDMRRIAGRILDESIRVAALSYPTIVSSTDPALRLLGPLVPALVYVSFLIVDGLHAPDPTFGRYSALVIFGVMPYVGVAYEVRILFGQGSFGLTAPPTTPTEGSARHPASGAA